MNLTSAIRWGAGLASAGLVVGALGVPATGVTDDGAGRAVAACTTHDVQVSYRARGAGMGHRYGVIRLRNVSDRACRTGGYGGVSYVGGGDGTQIGAAADRTPGTVRTFVLAPGDLLVSPISETVAQNYPRKRCRPADVDGFRVYIPNETRSQFVKHPTTGCRNVKVHLLEHKPYRRPRA